MNSSDKNYRDMIGIVKNENLPENLTCAIIDYLSGNENALRSVPDPFNSVLCQVSMVTKMLIISKTEEYKKAAESRIIFHENENDPVRFRLKNILNPDRIVDFNEVVKAMVDIGLLNPEMSFLKNRRKAHNQLISGVCAILFENNYFRKVDAFNSTITETCAVKTLFAFFKAKISIDDYLRIASKTRNITLARKRLPLLNIIEFERRKGNVA